jgi:hypothetical protein
VITIDQLNQLQQQGIISDNAVTWADVAECDKVKALKWLDNASFNDIVKETK